MFVCFVFFNLFFAMGVLRIYATLQQHDDKLGMNSVLSTARCWFIFYFLFIYLFIFEPRDLKNDQLLVKHCTRHCCLCCSITVGEGQIS